MAEDIAHVVEQSETVVERSETVAPAQPSVDELRMRLEAALQRVEALEVKLEKQSLGLQGEVEDLRSRTAATEVKVDNMPRQGPHVEATAMPELPSWPPAFLPDVWPDFTEQDSRRRPHKSELRLRRPFNFEEFRRSQSEGLQNERLRVL